MAEKITEETGKKAVVTDTRLLFSPVGIRDMPMAGKSRKYLIWGYQKVP